MTDIVERLMAYRDRAGRSREGRELLADACNEIMGQRREIAGLVRGYALALEKLARVDGCTKPN